MADNNTNKIYKTFKVGGDPTKIAFLAADLSNTVDKIQSSGWIIERIDSIDNTSAWDFHKQKHVSTTEYIIIAYRNKCVDLDDLADKFARVNIVSADEIRQMLESEEQ